MFLTLGALAASVVIPTADLTISEATKPPVFGLFAKRDIPKDTTITKADVELADIASAEHRPPINQLISERSVIGYMSPVDVKAKSVFTIHNALFRKVPALTRDFRRGEVIKLDDLTDSPAGGYGEEQVFRKSDLAGRLVRDDLPKGTQLSEKMLVPNTEAGMKAFKASLQSQSD